jgi:hypothetical protein
MLLVSLCFFYVSFRVLLSGVVLCLLLAADAVAVLAHPSTIEETFVKPPASLVYFALVFLSLRVSLQ